MKKALLLAAGVFVALIAYSAEDPYVEAMKSGLEKLGDSRTPQDFRDVSNQFVRIGETEKNKWRPFYYASYALTIAGAMEPDPAKKDETLDEAMTLLKRISDMEPNEAEVGAVEGFVYMLKIGVDPATRGQQYSAMSGSALGKAQKLDPDNPRVLYLQAQLSYGTSQFFGTGIQQACDLNSKALQLFEMEEVQHPFDPSWGKDQALSFQEQCSN